MRRNVPCYPGISPSVHNVPSPSDPSASRWRRAFAYLERPTSHDACARCAVWRRIACLRPDTASFPADCPYSCYPISCTLRHMVHMHKTTITDCECLLVHVKRRNRERRIAAASSKAVKSALWTATCDAFAALALCGLLVPSLRVSG